MDLVTAAAGLEVLGELPALIQARNRGTIEEQ
jgi:hypothetical protein